MTITQHNQPFSTARSPFLPPDGYSVAVGSDGWYYPQRIRGEASYPIIALPTASFPHRVLRFPAYSEALMSCWEEAFEVDETQFLAPVIQWHEAFTHPDQIEECQQVLEAWTGKRARIWSSTNGQALAHLGAFEGADGPFALCAYTDTYEEAIIHLVEQVYQLAAPLVELARERDWEQWWRYETAETPPTSRETSILSLFRQLHLRAVRPDKAGS